MRFWSVSTTVRNPERIRSFLKVLKSIEGEIWTKETQKRYQVLLIKNKVYGFGEPQFHNSLPDKYNAWLDGDITYEQVEEILDYKNYKGGGDMRGRQSFNPIKKMGLTYIDENNKIKITDFGNYFLQDNYDLGEVFFRSFLKWQYPNPDANKYKEDSYNIKPFIATLHLIKLVNEICKRKKIKVKGVSRVEFALFFVSLSNYKDIPNRAKEIVDFRLKHEKIKDEEYKKKFVENYFQNKYPEYESLSNAFEYTDNIIRYFRLTRYIYIRGNGWYIDLEPRRKVEINSLLETDNASAIKITSKNDYVKYLGDINTPTLPWETQDKLKEVICLLKNEIEQKVVELHHQNIETPLIPEIDTSSIDIDYLKTQTELLRNFRRKLYEIETHYTSQDIDKIDEYIEGLKEIFNVTKNRPVELERIVSLSLNALNDALEIKPNYPIGDDNEPTFTAPANKPDVECYYDSFNAICEVTLLTNKSQWFNEGQPVMRHVRDFEKHNKGKETYCLFIAPRLHRDTINTFWIATKYEYEGTPQKIVPMSISQFTELLQILKVLKEKGYFLTHKKIKELYDSIIEQTKLVNSSDEWISKIPEIIKEWKKTLLAT